MRTRIAILCLGLLLGAAAAAETGPIAIDWAAFAGKGDSSQVEFFYAVPYLELKDAFRAVDSGLAAQFSVRFEVTSANGFKQDAVIYKQARIDSFASAARSQRAFVDGFSLAMPPGRYGYRVTLATPAAVQSDTAGGTEFSEAGSTSDSIEVPGFSTGLALSTIQLAAGVAVDTVTGGFRVIPNPTRKFGTAGLDRVYFYLEGYGLGPKPDSYEVRSLVTGTGAVPETIVKSEPRVRWRAGPRVSAALGISIAGVKPGTYVLEVTLLDRASRQSVRRRAGFTVAGPEEEPGPASPYTLKLTPLEQKYYQRVEYIFTQRELGYFHSLGDSGKQAYLAWYWSKHNLAEFSRRMETADGRFKTSRTPGLETDRGRIYVKYGEPDEVERKVIEVDCKPREYWHYYGKGYVFVFIDLKNDNTYLLAYTNSPDEQQTGYEYYLTPDEQEMFH